MTTRTRKAWELFGVIAVIFVLGAFGAAALFFQDAGEPRVGGMRHYPEFTIDWRQVGPRDSGIISVKFKQQALASSSEYLGAINRAFGEIGVTHKIGAINPSPVAPERDSISLAVEPH